MKRKLIHTFAMAIISAMSTQAQTALRGVVADALGHQPIHQVNVTETRSHRGTTTLANGHFTITPQFDSTTIRFSAVGYAPAEMAQTSMPDTILLAPLTIGLKEVNIIASTTSDQRSPVASITLDRRLLDQLSAGKAFPESMRTIPGVYATRTGGGFGDARLNIRGFSQENITILLNGVPVNSVENGLVYWNNWEGLTEATASLQIQKGIGASGVAVNSAGGTVNLITKTTEATQGGSVAYNYTSYGNSRLMLSLATGRLESGWALSFTGSRTTGPGYVDGTYVDGWSYLLSAGKEFGRRHKLVFTLMGSPERHGQRNFELSVSETEQYGLRYNKDWGTLDGKLNNLSENFYHKPYFTVNHYFDVNERLFIATSAYATFGEGGGKWYETFSGTPIPGFRTPTGQIDWSGVLSNNQHADVYVTSAGDTLRNFSKNVQTHFRANHYWTGLLSTARYRVTDNTTLTAGVHGKWFKSKLWEEITNLLGGQYFIDDYGWAVEGASGREIKKNVGDIIKVDNGATVGHISTFGQLAWQTNQAEAFVAGGVNQTWYGRYDNYNYLNNNKAQGRNQAGFDLKGGAAWHLNQSHTLTLNGGYFSRAPYHKFVYPNWNNVPASNLRNEKLATLEAGYIFTYHPVRLRISAYFTTWEDKSVLSREYQLLENSTSTRAMMNGLDAVHKGLEADATVTFSERVRVQLSASAGDWKWKNNVEALLFNQANEIVDTVKVYADGLKVGDAPQLQAAATLWVLPLSNLELNVTWNWYDQLYASFDPASRTNPSDTQQPWRVPSYHTLDAGLTYKKQLFGQPVIFTMSGSNLLNHSYIIRGTDGINHSEAGFTGFWGFGRTFSFGAKINF